jgi:hypothetical protein
MKNKYDVKTEIQKATNQFVDRMMEHMDGPHVFVYHLITLAYTACMDPRDGEDMKAPLMRLQILYSNFISDITKGVCLGHLSTSPCEHEEQ